MPRPRKFAYADPKKRYTCECGSEMKYTSLATHLSSKKHADYVGCKYPFKIERNVTFHFTPEGEHRWVVSQQERAQEVQSVSSVAHLPPYSSSVSPSVRQEED